jgi:hypothetical protein
MKEVRNLTHAPLKIHLPEGKVLHLGPGKTGRISDHAAQAPAVRRLVDAGELQIIGEGDHVEAEVERGHAPHDSTHGHPQPTVVRPKGNR